MSAFRPRCDQCLYYIDISGAMKGECRRNPPHAYSAMNAEYSKVIKGGFCGEWRAQNDYPPNWPADLKKPTIAVTVQTGFAAGDGINREAAALKAQSTPSSLPAKGPERKQGR
jgi:hypothetical protein